MLMLVASYLNVRVAHTSIFKWQTRKMCPQRNCDVEKVPTYLEWIIRQSMIRLSWLIKHLASIVETATTIALLFSSRFYGNKKKLATTRIGLIEAVRDTGELE
jgi:hypothetical protein